MSTTYSPSGVRVKVYPYEDFQGIDASRDISALDTGQKQHMVEIENGFSDWRGTIVREAGASQRTEGDKLIKHLNFFGRNLAVWAQKEGSGIALQSERSEIVNENINSNTIFLTIENRGSGYDQANPPTVTFSDPTADGVTPSTATGTALIDANGELTEIEITSQGNGYNTDPTVTIDPPTSGTTAVVTAKMGTDVRTRTHYVEGAYPASSIVTSTIFNNNALFFARDHTPYKYDGLNWKKVEAGSDPRPAFGVSIQRRLAVSGAPAKRTVIELSRVDQLVFPDDEDPGSTDVLKAADIDIGNIIGTADEIKGLGVFESNRLAVFTNDQTLVYQISPDLTQWAIDDKANIKVGTISHNTIATAGADLMFCSREGVHSLRRSDTNGITIFSIPMSNKIDLVYREYLSLVKDKEQINAFYDQDEGQYHIFFPISDLLCKRLTITLNPMQGGESKWSSGTFLNATCGRKLGENTLLGTPGGIWERSDIEDIEEFSPEMKVTTPILWQGSINDTKESYSFILQATGQGELQVEAFDERGRYLSALQFLIQDGGADDKFPDVPLNRQYERKFEHRYRGVQFRFTTRGKGLLKIIGFAVTVRQG